MGISFARYEERSRRYLLGYAATIVVGGLAAISSDVDGFGVAQLLLTASFVFIIMYMGGRIGDDYRKQEFLGKEISVDEYMALSARVERYPDLKAKILEMLPESGHLSYADAARMEPIVNAHIPAGSQAEQEALEQYRAALYRKDAP